MVPVLKIDQNGLAKKRKSQNLKGNNSSFDSTDLNET